VSDYGLKISPSRSKKQTSKVSLILLCEETQLTFFFFFFWQSQLLDVLMEFNDSLHIKPSLRYDLASPEEDAPLSPESEDIATSTYSAAAAKSALREARTELEAGVITPDSYRRLEEGIKRNSTYQPAVKYTSLRQIPHNDPSEFYQDESEEGSLRYKLGYLTPEHETEYLLRTDIELGDQNATAQLNTQLPDKSTTFTERMRDANLANPSSVYNWLRRNTPQIFLQDNDNSSEKGGGGGPRPSNLRTSKRASSVRNNAKEEDMYDEDGIALDAPEPTSSKGKRKREEDTGYRPKGGRSGGTSRKKKETESINNNSNNNNNNSNSNFSGRRSKRSSGVGA
jgi:hypothetical protein